MKNQARILFMGTPAFAVPTLDELIQHGFEICGVVTAPDKPAGRGRQPRPSEVKEFALRHNLPLFQPEKLSDPSFLRAVEVLAPDLGVVVAFRMLPQPIWSLPLHGTINLHASLLPDYRGAAPINWVLINGETKTGMTTFFIDSGLDTGQILYQKEVEIGIDTTAGELHDDLMHEGAKLVLKTAVDILAGRVHPRTQPESKAPLNRAPKLSRESGRIKWNAEARKVHDLIRGLCPYPGAWTIISNKDDVPISLKVFKGQVVTDILIEAKPGSIHRSDYRMFIRCLDYWYELLEAQWPGRNRMPVRELLLGISINDQWRVLDH